MNKLTSKTTGGKLVIQAADDKRRVLEKIVDTLETWCYGPSDPRIEAKTFTQDKSKMARAINGCKSRIQSYMTTYVEMHKYDGAENNSSSQNSAENDNSLHKSIINCVMSFYKYLCNNKIEATNTRWLNKDMSKKLIDNVCSKSGYASYEIISSIDMSCNALFKTSSNQASDEMYVISILYSYARAYLRYMSLAH